MQSVRKHNDNKFIGSSEREKKKNNLKCQGHIELVFGCVAFVSQPCFVLILKTEVILVFPFRRQLLELEHCLLH